MGQRRHHYERAFEWYLRDRRVPFVSVNEARKVLLPGPDRFRIEGDDEGDQAPRTLKSFDFVLYDEAANFLVEIKGRKIGRAAASGNGKARSRLESWVTRDDVDCLLAWEDLFGRGFQAAFVFLYWCDEPPPAALFEEIFEFGNRWYAIRAVLVREYAQAMRTRSPRWGTVHLPAAAFDDMSVPLLGVAHEDHAHEA